MASLCPPFPYWALPMGSNMNKFRWAVVGFGFNHQGESFKLEIEEAEDALSSAAMLLKQARQQPAVNDEAIDLILQEIASAQDKVRKMRSDLKGL